MTGSDSRGCCFGGVLYRRAAWLFVPLLALALASGGCKKAHPTDTTALDQAGMWFNSVEQLRQIGVTGPEVQQLALARQGGMSDASCIELVRIAHDRHGTFADGATIAGLLSAGLSEDSVIALARMDQLNGWGGEAQVMRLAGLSDAVILAVARRRAAGEVVLSGAKVADLQNSGLTQSEIIAVIDRGTADAQADDIIYRRNYLAGGHRFVHQTGRRR